MAATPVFGLQASDLQLKIQPENGDYTFLIGDGGNMSTARAEEILGIAEDQAMMRIPTRYRQLLRECDGEVAVERARGGETTVRLLLYPITTDTLELYRNYPRHLPWKLRDKSQALIENEDYTVDESTGVVTMTTPLTSGDWVEATYSHTAGTRIPGLRDIVLSIAAVEVARQHSYFKTADGFDRFERWENSAYANLNQIRGIDLIDRVTLREDTDDSYAQILRL